MPISHDPYKYFTWSKLTIKNNPSIEGETWLQFANFETSHLICSEIDSKPRPALNQEAYILHQYRLII